MSRDDFIDGDEFDPEVAAKAEDAVYEKRVEMSDEIVRHIARSKQAYTRLFVTGNATQDDVDFVMNDLAWFTRAYDPLWSDNQRTQDRFTARREVFQRIVEYTKLDNNALYRRYVETNY